ncbi:hypothetical protein [Kitasatospora sp. McL0602]|uniref:hypothetical protein n=1 Tax=Kitasatospora sp. McL0602 TaxID=3439530 RepID=UPI003F897D4B
MTSDGCYYKRSNPQPEPGDKAWAGHDPASGAVYEVNCRDVGNVLTAKDPEFFTQPPGGPPPDRPVDLAWQAIGLMRFHVPKLHAAPAGTAVVGAPVWLWYERGDGTSDPQTATVSGHTLTVTAKAVVDNVHWDTGDHGAVDCATPGTEYAPGATASDCTYTYRTGSALQPQTSYYLTAVITWHVTATIVGRNKQVIDFMYPIASDVPLQLRVGEMQVLNN